jgi:PKD repeat protein
MMKYIYIFSFFLLAFVVKTNAQSTKPDTADFPYWINMMQDESVNFYDVQKAFYKFYDKHHDADAEEKEAAEGEEEGYGFELYKRWEYLMVRRINPDGSRRPADEAYKEFIKYSANALKKTGIKGGVTVPGSNPTGNWNSLGPTPLPQNTITQVNGVGRVNAIAFHPSNKGIIYIGAPCGGLWVTTDTGKTWTAKTDGLATLGVSAIAIDPTTPATIYIGTGDRDHYDAPGIGVMKSTNSGGTWSTSNSGMGNVIVSKLLINPSNSSILIAATSSGIFRSTNSGGSWTKTSSNSLFYKDLVFKPHNPNVMYAEENGNFYRSTNNGASWTKITSGLSSAYRGVIGVTPADTNRVYFVTTGTYTFSACYISTDGGSSFRTKATSPNIMDYADNGSGSGGQAFYDLCISVDTVKKGTLYVGGINIFKSTDSGINWACVAHWYGSSLPVVHADQHVFVINPWNNRLYVGHDGGIGYTANGGTSWNDISDGLGIGQIYKIGQSTARNDLMLAGFQDNGTAQLNNGNWYTVIGGDGMECTIDNKDTMYQYGEIYYGDMYRSTDGGQSFSDHIAGNGTGSISESGDWVTPYTMSKFNNRMMFAGYHNIWRCSDIKASAPSWTQISSSLASTNAYLVEAVEQSSLDSNIFYFSRSDNRLFLSTNITSSTPTWTDLTSNLPNSSSVVVEIKTHPKYPNVVYIIQSQNVYVSLNKGGSWTKITGTLPSIAKNTLAIDKNSYSGLYIGTDAGVYFRDSTMSDWTSFYNGLPAAARIMELEIYYDAVKSANNKLKAGSFGRGAWQSDLYSPVTPVAAFGINNKSQCLTGNSFSFTDSTTITAGSISSWSWDFGDGSTPSAAQNPKHSYTKAGTYTVKLIATSTLGTSDNISKTVTVYPQANPAFTINNFGQCLTGNSFTFTDKSTMTGGTISSWAWDFGDLKTSATQSPSHTYTSAGTFKVILTTTTSNGCTDSASKLVSVYPIPTASYSVNSSTQCQSGNSFVFTDKSTVTGSTIATWAWDFGDLKTSASQSPTHVYAAAGTYTVKLTVTTANGCTANTSTTVTVNPSPAAAYTINTSAQCLTGNSFTFTDKSTLSTGTIATWAWDFGDLNTSASQSPSHSYSNAGTYRVKLKITSNNGCTDTTSKNVIVLPQPSAAFTINNTAQCTKGNSFLFTDKTTIASGTISTWAWDFGDLNTGSNQNASHTYSNSGTYTVKLKVTSNGGCTDTLSKKISVYPSPVAAFNVNTSSQCLSGNNFAFTDKTTLASGSISTWAWDFGDGNTASSQNPSHSYGSAATYTVKLKITSNNGCTDTISKTVVVYPQASPSFSISNASQCFTGNSFIFTDNSTISSGTISTYAWDFGDAGTASSSKAIHNYASAGAFSVKLKITSNNGCTDSLTKKVNVNPQPVAAFGINSSTQCLGNNSFTFTDKSTVVSGTIASWSWDFGDLGTSSQQNPLHKYSLPGTYTIKLKITTNNNCTDTISGSVTVYPEPVAAFSTNNVNQCQAVNNFSFNDKSTISSGSIASWSWTFGDGAASTKQNPSYVYANPGSYTARLKIVSNNGCADSSTKTINVYPNPVSAFSVNSAEQCLPVNSFSFSDNSSVTGAKIGSWIWNFGDGINGSAQNPVHVYAKAGKYQVKLKAITNNNCVDSSVKTIKVDALPLPKVIGDTAVCAGLKAIYSVKKDSGSSYSWVVKGGTIVSGSGTDTISVFWPKFAGATVRVIETNTIGCVDSTDYFVFVMPAPSAKFGPNSAKICTGQAVQFRDSSSGSFKFLYRFGDGDTSDLQKPFHTYKKPGKYTVKLRITNTSGCTDSTSRTVNVNITPELHWTLSYSGNLARFKAIDSSQADSSYHWDLGDGTLASGRMVTHLYPKNKTYTVKLSMPWVGCGNEFDTTLDITKSVIEHFENQDITLKIFPNPFHDITTLEYTLPGSAHVKIGILDITGKEIGTVTDGVQVSGKYSFEINAGKYRLNPGIYFVKIIVNDQVVSRHVVKF